MICDKKARVLRLYLSGCGYNSEDLDCMISAYKKKGLEAAVATFSWADDDKHDYSGELREDLTLFEEVTK